MSLSTYYITLFLQIWRAVILRGRKVGEDGPTQTA
jgi:hypothetical protein